MTLQTPAESLSGDIVTLRRWHLEDALLVHRAVNESLDHLAPWMPFAANGYSAADGETFMQRCVTEWDAGQNFNYAILAPDGSVAGSCGIMSRPEDGVEIGYWLHVAHTGKGFATDAAATLTAQAWRIGAASVLIRHDEANVRSGAIPARLGFREVDRQPAETEKETSARVHINVFWRLDRPC